MPWTMWVTWKWVMCGFTPLRMPCCFCFLSDKGCHEGSVVVLVVLCVARSQGPWNAKALYDNVWVGEV